MPKHPRLQKRGSVYYLRVKVPADLRDTMGKREVPETLKTSDPREALKLVRKRSVEVDRDFRCTPTEARVRRACPCLRVDRDVARIVLQKFHDTESRSAADHSQTSPEDIDEIIEILNEDEAVLSGGLNETTEPGMASIADKLLTRHGLSLDHDHQLFNKFLRQLLRAELESVRRARERYNKN